MTFTQVVGRSFSYPTQRLSYGMDTPVTKLPPDLFQRVCALLNNRHRNWKTSAGALGKDVETVAVLDSDRVANPTEQLLREWAMLDDKVTVRDFLEVLAEPVSPVDGYHSDSARQGRYTQTFSLFLVYLLT
ncbi:uncharacterized protein LOC110985203 [Acanthaster planci]|uniref:Uncharacterized protein LOC110985203 n=1 Tax=Acanthaster planci TaxID=133434 RepID=A0A8B7Z9U7_ACAPL|nr:uncharacterized protein LOC110985203 [Acanthaster planci]